MDFFGPNQFQADGNDSQPGIDNSDDPVNPPKPKDGHLRFKPPASLLGKKGPAERAKLAAQIINMVYQDETQTSKLDDIATSIDELYLGYHRESLTPLWEDAPQYNAKTLGNKVKQLVTMIAGPMTALDPYFILRAGGPAAKPIDAVQMVLHKFLHDAKYSLALEESVNLVARRGRCATRVTYHPRKESKDGSRVKKGHIEILPIDVRYVRLYPNNTKTIKDARLFGYISQPRVREIDEMQRSGDYFSDVKIRAGTQKLQRMADGGISRQPDITNAIYREDDAVDIFDGILKKDLDGDGFEELYYVVVAKWQMALLKCEPFQCDQDWFADFFFEREYGRYRNEVSVASDLEDVHLFVNDSLNLMVQGSTYAVAPPMFGDFSLDDEVIRTSPGELRNVEGGGKIFSNQGRIDVTAFKDLYEIGENIADETAKVSQNGLGGTLNQGSPVTATEAQQAASGQRAGIMGYAKNIAYGAVDIARITLELLGRNIDDWYLDYRDVLPEVTAKDLLTDYWIQVNGEVPQDTPSVVLEQIQSIIQLISSMIQISQMAAQSPLLQAYPDILTNLLRSAIEATDLPNKESILPTKEEEASMGQQATLQQALMNMQQQQQMQQPNGNPQQNPNQPPVAPGSLGLSPQAGMGLHQAGAFPVPGSPPFQTSPGQLQQ